VGDEVLFRQDPSSGTFIVDAVTAMGEAVIYEREDARGQENRTTNVVSGFKLKLVPPLETRQGRLAVQEDRALFGHEEEQFQAQLTGSTQSSWFDGDKQDTNIKLASKEKRVVAQLRLVTQQCDDIKLRIELMASGPTGVNDLLEEIDEDKIQRNRVRRADANAVTAKFVAALRKRLEGASDGTVGVHVAEAGDRMKKFRSDQQLTGA
jgi:hypothetical protein